MSERRRYVWIVVAMLIVLSLACNLPTGKATPEGTEVAMGSATPALSASATMTPTLQTPGTLPPTPTEAPAVEGEGGCTLSAAYVADVTIPDDTKLAKDAEFVKTWRIRNSGTCTWKDGTKFVYDSGETMGAPVSVAVAETAPNAQVDISVSMKAPSTPGTYRSNWQLESPTGKRYGGKFYVQIVVEGPVTPTPTVTPGTPTPPTSLAGTVAADCSKVDFTWTAGTGAAGYKIEGPSLSASLAANAVSYTWNNPPAGSSTVALIAVAQGGSEIGRISTTVNVACGTAKPDLIVDSITFSPSPPVAFLPLQVTVQVRNLGPGDSGPFVLRWWGGKNFTSVSCEWNVSAGLTAGSSANLMCDNYKYSSPYGSIETKAFIDPDNSVAEANEDNNILEKSISVSNPQTVYDFVAKAPLVSWQSGDPTTNLSWNGAPGDAQGFARWATGQLETGNAIQGQCLETHPKWVSNGWIAGAYTDLYNNEGYVVQSGDVFRATVGFLQGAIAGKVTYKVTLPS